MVSRIALTVFVAFAAMPAAAQTLQEANALLNQSKYAEAQKGFQALINADENNGGAWLGLGQALERQKQPEKAVAAYVKAIDLKTSPKMATLFIARTYAGAGDSKNAYEWLTKVSESNPPAYLLTLLNSSPEFASIKDEPHFKAIQLKMTPCSAPEYHQFDFWIGSWEVQSPQGQVLGHNDVTLEDGGCVLQEHWNSLRTEKGTSFNYYDNRDKKWHQIYFDNSGNMGNYPPMAGGFADGRMVFLTDASQSPLSRWTFYPLDASGRKVRQWAEQSTDGGKTWTTTWDSVYVKKN